MNPAPDIPNIALWLDGQDSATLWANTARTTPATTTVNGWTDKSGANNHATSTGGGAAAIGTCNSKQGVHFDGSTSSLLTPSFLSGVGSDFTVYCVSDGLTADGVSFSDGGFTFWLQRKLSGSGLESWNTGGLSPASISMDGSNTGPQIDAFGYDSASTRVRLAQVRIDRRKDLSGSIGTFRVASTTGTLTASGAMTIGAIVGNSFKSNTTIGELIVVKGFPSDTLDSQILKYLAIKWGIGIRPYVACIGDSLTDGQGVADGSTYPQQLQTALGTARDVERFSYGGRTISEAFSEFAEYMAWPIWPEATGGQEIAVIYLGANEDSGGTDTQAIYLQLCQAFIARGAWLICCTCTPRARSGDDGTIFEAIRTPLNAYIKGQLVTDLGVPIHIADLAANSNIGPKSAIANTTYYQSDQTHLTAAGDTIVSGLVQAQLAATATMTQATASPGQTISGTYWGLTPTGINVTAGTATISNFTASAGAWSAKISGSPGSISLQMTNGSTNVNLSSLTLSSSPSSSLSLGLGMQL